MDATCAIQDSIHVFSLVRKYVSRILGTYQNCSPNFTFCDKDVYLLHYFYFLGFTFDIKTTVSTWHDTF